VTARARSPDAFALFRCEREREQTSGVRPKTPAAVVARRRAIAYTWIFGNERGDLARFLYCRSTYNTYACAIQKESQCLLVRTVATFSPFAPSQANAPRIGYKIPFSTLW
jgi:hypothetical protein